MENHLRRTVQNMKDGISKTFTKDEGQKTANKTEGEPEKKTETLHEFETRIMRAVGMGEGSVETTEEIFNYLTEGKPTPYLHYRGVRVYKEGTQEAIEKDEKISIVQKVHGGPA